MNKKINTTILIFLILGKCNFLNAQDYKITYEVSHITDSVTKRKLNYNALLFVGNNKSYFGSENKIANDSIMKKWQEAFTQGKLGDVINAPATKILSAFEMIEIYKNFDNKHIIKEVKTIPTGTSHLIIDTIQHIEWILTGETKMVLNYMCQKAYSNFKGRKWIVWFSKDISFANGPWKLGNLIGLILEAVSEDKTISFVAKGIEKSYINSNIFIIPNTIKLSSKKNYYKHLKVYANDPDTYFNTIHNVSQGDVIFSETPITTPKLKISSNPIEPYE